MHLPGTWRRSFWLGAVAAIAVAVLRPVPAGVDPGAPSVAGTPAPRTRTASNLPPALEASLSGQGLDLVSVIAADIDADGDLDVVASDSKLELIVWVNDGTGHLTRREAARATRWRPEPADPTLHERPGAINVSLQNEPPTVGVDNRLEFGTLAPARVASRRAPRALATAALSTRVPRSPPVQRLFS